MNELDFYQAKILNGGAFSGSALIQSSGSIGGARNVFVKLQSSAKGGLVYPPIGGVLKNPFKGNGKFFAGDLMEFDPGIDGDTGATVKILKTYEVAEAASSADGVYTVKIVRDGYRHIPFVGDYLMTAPSKLTGTGTAVTVTAVEKTTDATAGDVWVLTLSGALTAAKGAILVEASAGSGTVTAMVTNPNAYAPADGQMIFAPASDDTDFAGARYLYTPCLAGKDTVLYKSRMSPMPATVLALNTSKVNGWFSL